MRVTGNQILTRIKELTELRDHYKTQFTSSLQYYESQGKPEMSPGEAMKKYVECEDLLTILQVGQEHYNATVNVDVVGASMSLAQAIKLLGVSNRVSALWKTAPVVTGVTRSLYGLSTLNKEHEYPVNTLKSEEALVCQQEASKYARQVQEAVHKGNTYGKNVTILTPEIMGTEVGEEASA